MDAAGDRHYRTTATNGRSVIRMNRLDIISATTMTADPTAEGAASGILQRRQRHA
jgi:hypothetical protein